VNELIIAVLDCYTSESEQRTQISSANLHIVIILCKAQIYFLLIYLSDLFSAGSDEMRIHANLSIFRHTDLTVTNSMSNVRLQTMRIPQ
jgi:hypothetical protein